MSILTRTRPDHSLPSFGIVLAAMGAMARAVRNRRAARRVADLPDYLLTDVGLKRDDVSDALSAHWRDDPTFQLALRASERRRTQ